MILTLFQQQRSHKAPYVVFTPHSHWYYLCTTQNLILEKSNTSLRHCRIILHPPPCPPLCSAGICVRCNVASVYMHHKFAVVDGRLLITGSLNWTLTAVQSNMENVLVTEEPDLVRPFIKEFHRIWEHNDPTQHRRSSDRRPARGTTRLETD